MHVGRIESGVPMEGRGRKRRDYTQVFDQMAVGDSFTVEGTDSELKGFRSALRSRNLRNKEAFGSVDAPVFDWGYENASVIRIWRLR